jgi:hypothetical protein
VRGIADVLVQDIAAFPLNSLTTVR